MGLMEVCRCEHAKGEHTLVREGDRLDIGRCTVCECIGFRSGFGPGDVMERMFEKGIC
jgi:hypothetical protein